MDLDRKIRRGRERLAQDSAVPMPIPGKIAEQLSAREEQVKKLLEQIEELGEAGKVDEAEALMRRVLTWKIHLVSLLCLKKYFINLCNCHLISGLQVDILNAEKTALANQADNKVAMLEKKMELCETCGSFLVADDALERTQSHVTGKQHIGYGMVRDFLTEYKVKYHYIRSINTDLIIKYLWLSLTVQAAKEKAKEEERLAREQKAEERRKQRGKEYDSGGRDSGIRRERSGDHDYDRDRQYERSRGRDRPYDHRDRGSEYRSNSYRNGRDSERGGHRYRSGDMTNDRGRMRSRSRSPNRHGYGRSRSPDH